MLSTSQDAVVYYAHGDALAMRHGDDIISVGPCPSEHNIAPRIVQAVRTHPPLGYALRFIESQA
jgi:hypothetical protein